ILIIILLPIETDIEHFLQIVSGFRAVPCLIGGRSRIVATGDGLFQPVDRSIFFGQTFTQQWCAGCIDQITSLYFVIRSCSFLPWSAIKQNIGIKSGFPAHVGISPGFISQLGGGKLPVYQISFIVLIPLESTTILHFKLTNQAFEGFVVSPVIVPIGTPKEVVTDLVSLLIYVLYPPQDFIVPRTFLHKQIVISLRIGLHILLREF